MTTAIATIELLALILPRLQGVKGPGSSGNYDSKCPFHDDRSASLSLHAKTGLWQCHAAGCGRKGNAYQLAQELGCLAGLSRDKEIAHVNWGLDDTMQRYGIKVHQRGVIFPIRDHQGNRCRDHVRLHEGDPRFQYWGKGRIYHALVEWDLVREWGKGAGIAYMVEGNRDWLALTAHGWPAIGILGTEHFGKAREEAFGHLKAAGIGALVVTPDNDDPGREAARQWVQTLSRDGFLVGVRTLPATANGRSVKDTFDLYQATGSDFNAWLHELPIEWRDSWA